MAGKRYSWIERKRKRQTSVVLLLCLLFALGGVAKMAAQPLCDMKMYSYQDGLTHSAATDILQGKNGLIWLSTWNGLMRFDGYTFENHKSYPGDGCAMKNSRINSIRENRYGNIWCFAQDGKAFLFDVHSERFIDVLAQIEAEIHRTMVVQHIYTLEKGVTWLLCEQGYCFRVDDSLCVEGKGVELYSLSDQRLKGEEIYRVQEDKQGDEWVFTNKGITIVGNKTMNSDFPFRFVKQYGESVWLASENGRLAEYNPSDGQVKFISLPPSVKQCYSIHNVGDSMIGLGTNAGLLLVNVYHHGMSQIHVNTPESPLDEVLSLYKDRMGDYWMFNSSAGVLHYDHNNRRVRWMQSPTNTDIIHEQPNRTAIFEDNHGYLWVIPRNGNLCYYDRDKEQLAYCYMNESAQTEVVSPSVRTYCIDSQGDVWFGSKRSFGKLSFFTRKVELTPIGDEELEIRSFLLDHRKHLWAASKGGKLRIYDAEGQCMGYLSSQGKLNKNSVQFKSNVYCMMEDKHHNIWLGCRGNGLFLLTPNSKGQYDYELKHFMNNPADIYSINSDNVYSLCQDRRGRIWVGTYGGGPNLIEQDSTGNYRFINESNRLEAYPMKYGKNVRHIVESNGIILLGTTDGLITYSSEFDYPEEIRFYRNSGEKGNRFSLSSSDVMYVYIDKNGSIYLATQNGGVCQAVSDNLLSENILFKSLTEKNGLASDMTCGMLGDTSGCLWILSKYAISRYNPTNGAIDNFGAYTFMQEYTFSESAITYDGLGRLALGTDKGILSFNPFEMNKSRYEPPVLMTHLKIHGDTVNIPLFDQTSLSLEPSQRSITLRYAALDYRDSKEIRYAYFMEGLDSDWHDADKTRSAVYINLPVGHYTFKVKSTNSDGVWMNNIKELPIVVLPTFWETPWAWSLYVLFFISLIYGIVYVLFLIYRLRHKVDMEQQVADVKLRFFTDISHELRTPLTLISTPVSEVLENEPLSPTAKAHLELVQKNTGRMLRLINQILDFRKIQNKKMKVMVEETDVVPLLSKIMDNFRLVAEEKKMSFSLDAPMESLLLWVDRDKVEKIIYNLLSNAFKYTKEGKSVVVHLRENEHTATISVQDQGIGIPQKKLEAVFERFETADGQDLTQYSSGIGLSLVKELVELHHGQISASSKIGQGSEFVVTFLKGNAHFKEEEVDYILNDCHAPEVVSDDSSEALLPLVPSEASSKAVKGKSLSILVVEDNIELLDFLTEILSVEYHVLRAVNGEEGLHKVKSEMPDLIISDVMMPVMDGLEMVKAIKEDNCICHTPIILLSAKASLDDRIEGLESGIDDYITKPFSATYLKTRIRSLINQRKALQEMFLLSLQPNEDGGSIDMCPSPPKIAHFDEMFMMQVMAYMEQNMDNSTLTIDDFAKELSLSRTVFYRKIKSILGITPIDFIRDIRIKRAVQLIDSGDYSFSEIAYKCGFNDPNYFSKCFKRQMGVSPSEYKASMSNR